MIGMSDKKLRVSLLLLVLAVLSFHYAYKERPDEKQVRDISRSIAKAAYWTGKYPPDFTATALDGSAVALADQIGRKAIVLNFFATWCEPCVEEMPELNRYYLAHRDEDFLLVAIDAGEKESEVVKFVAEQRLAFPVVADTEGAIKKLYGVESLPTSVFIGADGRIVLYEAGGIANADVTFTEPLRRARESIAAGRGIARAAYLEGLKGQPPPPAGDEEKKEEKVVLEGRALELAARMSCVCGCEHTLQECECSTGTKMMKELQALKADDPRSDEEIIREINRKYCAGSTG